MTEARFKKVKQTDFPSEFIFHLSRHSLFFEGKRVCDSCKKEIPLEIIPIYIRYGIMTDIQAKLPLCKACLKKEGYNELLHLDYLKPIEDNLLEIKKFTG